MDPKTLKNMLGRGAEEDTSALAPYSGSKKDDDLVDEDIDERILRLLGLEDVFDIDYGTYKTLLREKLAEGRLSGKELAREEDELLLNEFRRIKGKEGRFKVQKKKIKADDIFPQRSGAITLYRNVSALSKDLALQNQEPEKEKKETGIDKSIGDNLKVINKTLDKILKSILSQGESERKRREKDRISGERRKAQERESGLEKPLQIAKKLVNKIISPFRGILDSVFRFLKFTFLGWLIGKYEEIEKWIGANKDKINVVARFLKDWWPALLGAYVLFATPFGKFIRGTLKMLRGFIPKIIGLMRANPMLAALTLATVGGIAKIKESERIKPDVEKIEAETNKTLKSKEAPWYEKLGASLANQSLNAPTGPKNPTGLPTPGAMFARGGKVPLFGFSNGSSVGNYFSGYVDKNTGVPVKGFGQDTQAFPIEGGGTGVLKPGEIVMNTGAVNAIGPDKLLAWNKKFGGPNANKPVNFTYNSGGVIGLQNGGILGTLGRFLPGTGTVMSPQGTTLGYQNKIFGINVGEKRLPLTENYSQQEVNRYNTNINSPSTLVKFGYGPLSERYLSVPKTRQAETSTSTQRSSKSNSTGLNPFKNFNRNIQTIKGAANRQEEMMRQMGHKPSGYVNLFGQPVKKQSGGVVPQGPFTPLPAPGYVRPQGSFIPKPILRLPGPMPGTTVPFGFNPFKGLQGGGVVPQGPFTPLPAPGYVRPQGSFIPKPILRLPGPMPGTTVPFGFNPFKGLQGGGVVRKQSGGVVPFSRGTKQFGEVPLIRAALSMGIKGTELAAFLAQMSHETGGFKWSRELGRGEGMGYSGGSRYHGRGYTQLTHDYNYRDFGKKLGVDLIKDPDLLLRDPSLSARVAIEYWKERVRPRVKDWNDVFAHSAAINRPAATSPSEIRGYEDRMNRFNYYNQNLSSIISKTIPPNKPKPKSKPPTFMDKVSGFVSGIGSLFGRGAYAKPKKKQGGGGIPITTETGIDIPGGLSGADTQFLPPLSPGLPPLAVQPGEELYVVPKQAVPQMDAMVAKFDRNSNPAKIQSNLRGDIGPKVTFITLPNKVTSTPPKGGGLSPGKPQLPEFEVIMDSPKRSEVASALGIVDLV